MWKWNYPKYASYEAISPKSYSSCIHLHTNYIAYISFVYMTLYSLQSDFIFMIKLDLHNNPVIISCYTGPVWCSY